MRIAQTLTSIAVIIASATSVSAGTFFEDVGRVFDEGVQEAGKVIQKGAHEAGRVIDNSADETGKPWSITIDADNTTGKFSSCTASATYGNGITLVVVIDRNWKWDLGFRFPNWQMRKGKNIALEYRFDRSQRRWAVAKVTAPDMAVITITDGKMVKLFRQGRMMTIYDGQRHYAFSLAGTSKMLSNLANCVSTRLDAEKSTNGSGHQTTN